MALLLSRDTFSSRGPPTLLQVWFNIQASVRALEAGLSAARCAQTTVVAADFANNLMSLAELGCEVSQKGWIHGLGIMAQELIHMQVGSRDGHYTGAVKGALKNSQKIARNIHALAIEDAPIISFLQNIVGRGWLWGFIDPPLPESTVVITELTDEGEAVDMDETQVEGSCSKAKQLQCRLDGSDTLIFDRPGHGLDSTLPVENVVSVKRTADECRTYAVDRMSNSFIKSNQQGVDDAIDEQEVSDLLEFVACVHERGLISDVVKISFESMLSGEPAKAVVENLKISLKNIAEKGDCQPRQHRFWVDTAFKSDDDDHKVRDLKSEPFAAQFTPRESGKCVHQGILNLGTSSDVGSSSPEDRISDVVTLGFSETAGVEADVLVKTPVISNQSSWEEAPFTDLTPNDAMSSTSWEAFPSSMVEPSSCFALSSEISSRLQLEPDGSLASPPTKHKDENDVKKRIGGGIAVLGAVLGSVALHNAKKEEGNNECHDRRQSERVVGFSCELDEIGRAHV